jgi:FkbM family methyltransferase
MNRIRKILIALLGEDKYLAFLASSFQKLYKARLLNRSYQDIYFLKRIIEPGNYCIDIGAHLGYYTLEMSRLASDYGKIFAIEPMSKFQRALSGLMKKNRIVNVTIYQVALGGDSDFVDMGIPQVGMMKKYGYARVMQTSTFLEYIETEKVKNESGDLLFAGLPRLDFIKCDVEGLEVAVFTSMVESIGKHRPIILCELGDKKERIKLFEMILPFGYHAYILKDSKLRLLDVYSDQQPISHNHYFIPDEKKGRFKYLIRI